ncbi:unnamed protein product [Trichogramma brassicae]|uniref:Uncharacterized protein n=1 Tax=Trichogramma brassicae TaxID=86971 RepID=A0A6H5J0F0_9HYME|nr:unnamed protein product [Trichogramma brassicae]
MALRLLLKVKNYNKLCGDLLVLKLVKKSSYACAQFIQPEPELRPGATTASSSSSSTTTATATATADLSSSSHSPSSSASSSSSDAELAVPAGAHSAADRQPSSSSSARCRSRRHGSSDAAPSRLPIRLSADHSAPPPPSADDDDHLSLLHDVCGSERRWYRTAHSRRRRRAKRRYELRALRLEFLKRERHESDTHARRRACRFVRLVNDDLKNSTLTIRASLHYNMYDRLCVATAATI